MTNDGNGKKPEVVHDLTFYPDGIEEAVSKYLLGLDPWGPSTKTIVGKVKNRSLSVCLSQGHIARIFWNGKERAACYIPGRRYVDRMLDECEAFQNFIAQNARQSVPASETAISALTPTRTAHGGTGAMARQ